MLIDSHTHLESYHRKGELDTVLNECAEAGVGELITVGTSQADWALYEELVGKHPGRIHYTVGLHPCEVEDDWEGQVMQLAAYFGEKPRPVALGEIGLDHFHLPKFPDEAAEVQARQREAFVAQLELAHQLDCPVVVHSRGACEACIEVIDASPVRWERVVFHCWSEGPDLLAAINERGGWGSFTGVLTFKNAAEVRAACAAQGLDRVMLETDAPYLAPMPHRGKPNRPAFVTHTAAVAAEVLGVSSEELTARASANTRAFFGLPAEG